MHVPIKIKKSILTASNSYRIAIKHEKIIIDWLRKNTKLTNDELDTSLEDLIVDSLHTEILKSGDEAEYIIDYLENWNDEEEDKYEVNS